mmetsp:Transcript_7819/g.17176  ORF Transcript_7819/g.17176 Transcript_7819/m.17176 type:complete len:107 (+) Transcript_7819:138-458(+)
MCQATCSETPEESATPTATNNAWWQGGQLLAVGIVLLAPTCSIAVYQAVRAALRRTIPYAVFPGPASFISSGGRYDHTNTPVLDRLTLRRWHNAFEQGKFKKWQRH